MEYLTAQVASETVAGRSVGSTNVQLGKSSQSTEDQKRIQHRSASLRVQGLCVVSAIVLCCLDGEIWRGCSCGAEG